MSESRVIMEQYLDKLNTANTSYERKKWYEKAVNWLKSHKVLNRFYELITTARKYIDRIKRKVIDNSLESHITYVDCAPMAKGTQQLYLVRLLDVNGTLVWSKVGTTTRETTQRMKEHLTYYKKNGIHSLEVIAMYDCNGVPAEAFESAFRAKYIMKYPLAFQKNDRFTKVEFDLKEAQHIFDALQGEGNVT